MSDKKLPPLSYAEQMAVELFGGIPKGRFCGMPIMVDPAMPNDRIRVVDPATGTYSDFSIPKDANPT